MGARGWGLKDVARQVFAGGEFFQAGVDIGGIDFDFFAAAPFGFEGEVVEQAFHDGIEPAGADVLGAFVDLPGEFGEAADGVVGEGEFDAFGPHQCLILAGQAGVGLGQDAFEIRDRQAGKFDPDGEAALQFRDQIGRFGQVEGTAGDEKDVVGLDHAVLGRDGGSSNSGARKMGSLLSWIKTNSSAQTNGGDPTTIGVSTRTDGNTRTFTEALLKEVVAEVFVSGGSPTVLMVGAAGKQKVSSFAGIGETRFNVTGAKPSTIIGAADIYVNLGVAA